MAFRSNQTNFAAQTYPTPNYGGGGGGSAQFQTTFVYKPGAIGVQAPVYSSWSALMTAVGNVNGPKIIQIDDSIVSPAVIPSGTWNIQDCIITGTPNINYSTPPSAALQVSAQCANGCVLENFSVLGDNISLVSISSSPVITLVDSGFYIIGKNSNMSTVKVANGPILYAPASISNNAPIIYVGAASTLGDSGESIQVDTTTGLIILLFEPGILNNDCVTGAGALVVIYGSCATVQGSDLPLSQSGIGTFIVIDQSKYEFANYFCESLSTAGVAGATTTVPPGYALTTTSTASCGINLQANALLTTLNVEFVGNVANAGKTVTFQLTKNGTPISGAFVTLSAATSATVGGGVSFLSAVDMNTINKNITLTVTPSAALSQPITAINAWVL